MAIMAIEEVRSEALSLLEGGNAHAGFDDIMRDFPAELRGKRSKGLPYSGWELLEHMRLSQRDILDFVRDPDYESPAWPDGYWPKEPSPSDDEAWDASVEAFRRDREAISELVADESSSLVQKLPQGTGQNLLREALTVADHSAFHLGQMVVVRRLLGAWKSE